MRSILKSVTYLFAFFAVNSIYKNSCINLIKICNVFIYSLRNILKVTFYKGAA